MPANNTSRFPSAPSSAEEAPRLTIADVANFLGVSPGVTRELLRNNKIRGGKVGGQWRITPKDLAEYVMATFE